MINFADLLNNEQFKDYTIEIAQAKNSMYFSDIANFSPEFDAAATGAGVVVNIPVFKGLMDEARTELNDGHNIVATNVGTGNNRAVKVGYGTGKLIADMVRKASGSSDVLASIANSVGDYFIKQRVITMTSSLTGVIADNMANGAGDMLTSAHGATNADVTALTKMSYQNILMAMTGIGENALDLAGIAMHSGAYFGLRENDPKGFTEEVVNGIKEVRYRGFKIIVSDNCPIELSGGSGATDTAVNYTSYLFGEGAVSIGIGEVENRLEPYRLSTESISGLIVRDMSIVHPMGMEYKGSESEFPDLATLKQAASWERSAARKDIVFSAIKTN